MPLYVLDPEAVLAFRQNHRRQVQRDRARKRKKNAEKPRYPANTELDRQWMAAVERDGS